MTTYIVNDQLDWDSELSQSVDANDCRTLTLKVKAFCLAHPPGGYSFRATINGEGGAPPRLVWKWMRISEHDSSHVRQFEQDFANCINTRFNDALWILHSGSRTGCYGDISQTYHNVKCAVEVDFVRRREDAQLVIQMFYQPTGSEAWRFRENCALGGRARQWGPRRWLGVGDNPVDMQLCDDAHVDRTRTDETLSGSAPFQQCVALHEFGHYLGLPHRCASEGALNSDAQYCLGGHRSEAVMSDLMAVGNAIRPRHAQPWIERIAAHNYSPGELSVSWTGSTTPPRALTPADYPRECRPRE